MNSFTWLNNPRNLRNLTVKCSVLVVIMVLSLILPLASAQTQVSVKWYKDNEEVTAIVPNTLYTAIIKIESDKQIQTIVEIKVDNINWFDTVIASEKVILKPGENIIKIPFAFTADVVSEDGSIPSVLKNTRGLFVKVSGVLDVSDVNARLASGVQIPLLSYYWVGLKMLVNGKEVGYHDYYPVYPGDRVKITGKLYKDGNPVPGAVIKYTGVVDELDGSTTTNSEGYFSIYTVAPDWKKYFLCGDRGNYVTISARINSQEVARWKFLCTYACEQKPEVVITIKDVVGYTAAVSMLAAGIYLIARKFIRM